MSRVLKNYRNTSGSDEKALKSLSENSTPISEFSFSNLCLKQNFIKYLVEERSNLYTFLIPGCDIGEILPYLDYERTKVFSKLSVYAPLGSDLDGLDKYYYHMLLIDPSSNDLIGAQRLRFNFLNRKIFSDQSYLEQSNPGFHEKLVSKNRNFVEVGRTFVTEKYKNRTWLKELIRGFVRIPASIGINFVYGLVSFNHLLYNQNTISYFINSLEKYTLLGDLGLVKSSVLSSSLLNTDILDLKELEKLIQLKDSNFRIPTVLYMYSLYCNVKYEGYSIADNYNKIMQLLFSGSVDSINEKYCSSLKSYGIDLDWIN